MHKESHNLRHHEYMEGGVGKAARDTPPVANGSHSTPTAQWGNVGAHYISGGTQHAPHRCHVYCNCVTYNNRFTAPV